MTTTVIRYRCDICGSMSVMQSIAAFCEQACEESALADALAAGSRRAKTPKAVECEASQSGGGAVTPERSSND